MGVVLLNQNNFSTGEKVKANQSGITALVTATTAGDRDITNQYQLNPNQKPP